MNQTKKKNPLKRLLSMRGMGQVVTVTIGLIVLLVAFALINPNFWSPTNRTNLLRQIAPLFTQRRHLRRQLGDPLAQRRGVLYLFQ